MLIPLFIRIWSARQQARRVGIGGEGITARPVLVCTYMPLLHTDSLRQHCSERWGRWWKGSGGWIKRVGGGGKGNRKGVVFLNTLSISLRSVVRTPACRERRGDAQQIFNWSSARCAGWIFHPAHKKKTIDLRWICSELVHEPLIVLFYY